MVAGLGTRGPTRTRVGSRESRKLRALREQGKDPVVLSLVELQLRLPPEEESCLVGKRSVTTHSRY